MKANQNSILNDIRFRTELLESLGWDENQLSSLFEYLKTELDNDTKLNIIMSHIKDNYNNSTYEIIKNIFVKESLFISVGFKDEH